MNPNAEWLARQGSWGISGASVITGETLSACAADAGPIAALLGLRPDVAVPGPVNRAGRSATADERDASAPACPAA